MRVVTYFYIPLQLFVLTSSAVADNFGAIAYDIKSNAYGASWDQPSQDSANQLALSQCAKNSSNCFVVAQFANQCGAYATGPGETWGYGTGPTQGVAERAAEFYCNQQGGGCRVRVWACNTRAGGNYYEPSNDSSARVDPGAQARNRAYAEESRRWGGQEQYDRVCSESPGGC